MNDEEVEDFIFKAVDLRFDLLERVTEKWLVAGLKFSLDEGPDPGPPPNIEDVTFQESNGKFYWVYERKPSPWNVNSISS